MKKTGIQSVQGGGFASRLARLAGRRCLQDETGAVLLYTVVVSFFLLAVFSLIFDVARVSETKMRMQDAADAAALHFTTVQARGMNTVQNINNDIYNTNMAALTLYGMGTGLALGAQAAYASGLASWIGLVIDGFASTSIGAAGYLRNFAVNTGLKPLRMVHVYGTMPMAYLAANEAARKNDAGNLLYGGQDAALNSGWGLVDSFLERTSLDGVYVLPVPTALDTALMLPLESFDGHGGMPMETENFIQTLREMMNAAPLTFTRKLASLRVNVFNQTIGIMDDWSDSSYVSKYPYNEEGQTFLPPVVMLTMDSSDLGLFSEHLLGGEEPPPIMAYAVGQCQGGNVVPHRDGKNYGVGADAALVPFSAVSEHFRSIDDGDTGSPLWNALHDLGLFLH